MGEVDLRLQQAGAMYEAGQYAEALSLLQQLFAEAELAFEPTSSSYFMTVFQWRLLTERYPPASAALEVVRNDQVQRLLTGDLFFGRGESHGREAEMFRRVLRISLIIEMNDVLADPRSTYELFVQLDANQPELAREYAWRALPAVVEVGDYMLADRYRDDPLRFLGNVNEAARTLPLFPKAGMAPRLAAELTNFVRDVRISVLTLRGLGRDAESIALRHALLVGLESDAMRTLAQRELDEPGALHREVVDRQMAEENQAES
jgi:hypothetical protein